MPSITSPDISAARAFAIATPLGAIFQSNNKKQTKDMIQLYLVNSMVRSPWRRGFLLIPLTLVSFAFSPQARAVCEQGCGSNANTFLGDGALANTTTGAENTATGAAALGLDTTGSRNTASGSGALQKNTTGSDDKALG